MDVYRFIAMIIGFKRFKRMVRRPKSLDARDSSGLSYRFKEIYRFMEVQAMSKGSGDARGSGVW